MREYKKYWWALVAVVTIAFGILGYYGVEVYREAPPGVGFWRGKRSAVCRWARCGDTERIRRLTGRLIGYIKS